MPNEYDDILREQRSDQLNAAMAVGVKAQPDTEAQLQKLAERTGVPLEAVRLKRPELEEQEKLNSFDYERVIKESPKLSAWLSDPANAALAHDDWENMSGIEQLVTRVSDIPRAFGGGVVRDFAGTALTGTAEYIEAGARGLDAPFRMAFDAKPFETLVTAGGANLNPVQSLKHTGRVIKSAGDWIAPPKERQNFGTDVASAIGQITGQIATFMLTGGAATVATMYAQGADVMANKIAKDVADQPLKDTAVLAGGAITAITEKYGLDKILNRVPPEIKNRTLRFIADKVAAGGIEAGQEVAEGLLHDLTRKVLTNADAELGDGALYEGGVAATSAAIVRTALGIRGHRQAQQQEEMIKGLTDQAAASKLRERYPEKFQAYIAELTKDGPVENIFVPADQFATYFQSVKMDPAVIASQLGVQNYHEAITAGGDVVIPTSAFVTQLSGTDHLQGLWEDLRLSQDAMTRRELRVQEMNRPAEVDDANAAAMAAEADTTSEAYTTAYNHFMGELKGRFDDSMAEAYAKQSAAAFSTLSARMGVSVQELIGKYDPRVVAELDNDLRAVLDGVDIDIDPVLDRLRAGDIPSEALAFGNSLYEFIRDNGGLQAVGEVLNLDESIDRKPGQKKIAQETGMALDMALEAAAEAGYFPGRDVADLTPADLLDALGDDIRGARIYSAHNEQDKSAQELRTLQSMQNWLSEQGIDLATMSNQQVRERLAMAADVGAEVYDETYNQEARRDLIVAHNLSAANLLHAVELGGLPVPSLAVTKADAPLTGYGEITLIGGADMAKPSAKNPIFDADVYSPRFPSVKVKVNEAAVKKVLKPLQDAAQELGVSARGVDGAIDEMERGKLGDAVSRVTYDTGMRLGYATSVLGKKIDIPREAPKPVAKAGAPLIEQSPLKEALAGKTQADIKGLSPVESQVLAQKIYVALINKMLAEDKASDTPKGYEETMKLVNRRISIWADNTIQRNSMDIQPDLIGMLTHKGEMALRNLMSNAAAPARTEDASSEAPVDVVALGRLLDKEVPREQMDGWVREKLAPSMGEKRIVKENGTTGAYTMANIVREMTRKVRDAEGFNYGLGNARAKLATKFKKLSEIQSQRDRVVSGEEFEAARKEIEAEFRALTDLVEGLKTYERDSTSELLAEAIGDVFTKGVPKALEDASFKGVPEDVQKRIGEFAAALAGAPTEYFEIKPQRAVALDEFTGAVVPADASPEVLQVLQGAGLAIKTYDRSSPEARANAVSELSAEMDAGNGTVLFQSTPRLTKRGMIQIGGDRKLRISLFAQADASTFLHESGHMYLEILRDLAVDERAPQQIRDDWAQIRDWMGLKDGEPIGVEQHEMFARANEAYLMEGNAPNPELRGVFQRFKAWLVRIYRDVSRLNVPIDNRIRGVFDRIYATDQQIEAAASELEMSVAWASAAEAGMTEAEYAAYQQTVAQAVERADSQLSTKLIAEYERERKRWWKHERDLAKKQVTEQVDAEPVYVAFKALTTGQMEDGTPLKLSREDLVAKFGEPFVVGLPRGKNRIYAEEGGTDIDTAAEVLGFESGRELINQIANMRKRDELIDARTDAVMREAHGDTLVDGTIEEAANIAVHNGKREAMLKIELRHIRKKAAEVGRINRAMQSEQAQQRAAGEQFVKDALPSTERTRTGADGQTTTYTAFDPEPMKRAAAGLIGQKQVRDLKPQTYLLAERKAAKAFAKAMKDVDYMTAAEQKQRELFNHYLYRAAVDTRTEMEGKAKYLSKQGKEPARARLGKAGADYLEQVDEILERYEFKAVPLNKIAKRESLMAFVNRMEAEGKAVEVPEEVLMEGRRVNWQQMTVDELRAVHDAVTNITHMARMKNKLLLRAKMRDFDQTKDELLQALAASGMKGAPLMANERDMSFTQKVGHSWRKFDASLLKIEQLLLWMDGGKPGPWTEVIFGLADQAQTAEYDLHRLVTVSLAKLRKTMPDGWRRGLGDMTGIRIPMPAQSGFVETDISRYTMLSIALNMGNAQNMQRLRDGNRITDMHMRQIHAAMTDADWQFVQGAWDSIEQLWPEIAALEKRVSGLEPVKVEPQSFEIRGNTYSGGYFPIVYDPVRSIQGDKQVNADQDVQAFFASGFGRPTTNKGATKARQDVVNAPLHLDLNSVIGGHIAKVVKDISHREAITAMNRLLSDSELRAAITTTVGPEYYQQMQAWMKTLVADRADALMGSTGAVKWMMAARTNLSTALMGFRISTALTQFAGLFAAMDMVNPSHLAKAFIQSSASPSQTWAMVAEKSGEMRHRVETLDRDVRDSIRRLAGDDTLVADVKRHAFIMVQYADKFVTVPTWLGAYNQALAEGKSEEAAVLAGDSAVRLTQGSGGAKDLAAVQRSNELMKMFTMFYTPFSALYARMRDISHQTAVQGIGYLPTAVARVFPLVIFPAIVGELLAGRGPDDDEDEVWWAIRQSLMYPMASIPFVRDFTGLAEQQMIALSGDGSMDFAPSYQLSPVVGAINKAWNGLVRNPLAVAAGDKDFDSDMAWKMWDATGIITGLPTSQTTVTGSYITDLLSGEADPENAGELVRDLIYRRKKE